MSAIEITLKGTLSAGEITLTKLTKALDCFGKLIKAISPEDYKVTVSDVRSGSITIEAEPSRGAAISLRDGIESIQKDKPLPSCWNNNALKQLNDLCKTNQKNGGIILTQDGQQTQLDNRLVKSIDSILKCQPKTLISLRGYLKAYSTVDNKPHTTLVDEITGKKIRVKFDHKQKNVIIGLLEKRVEVKGLATLKTDTKEIQELIEICEIAEVPEAKRDLTKLASVYGVAKGMFPSDKSSVELLREIRQEVWEGRTA